MFEIYHPRESYSIGKGETRYQAWKDFYEGANYFADNINEFRSVMTSKGYKSRKVLTNKEGR